VKNEFDVFSTKFSHDIYLQKYSKDGLETWSDTAKRVTEAVCSQLLDTKTKEKIFNIILERKFIPGGRYLYSAGREFHQVNNCFLFRVEDSRESWAELMGKSTASLMTGGGIGVDYSRLREEGALIRRTGGTSTGPIATMNMTNEVGRYVMQGGQRRCLPKGSLVHTKGGLIPIEEVRPGNLALTKDGFHEVLANLRQGIQETVKVKLQNGDFVCTPNHKIAVLKNILGEYEWIEAQHLEAGMRVLHTNDEIPGTRTSLPPSNYIRSRRATTVKEITIPELDADMAWFFGYFHANGHVRIQENSPGKRNSVIGICLPTQATEAIEKVCKQLSRFGINFAIKDGDGDCKVVKAASVPLALWMEENLKVANESIKIPSFIKEGTVDVRSAYIAGMLDGDGCVIGRPIIITNTVYENYAKELQILLSSLGIVTRFHLNRPQMGKWKPLYRITLKGTKQVGLFYERVGRYLVYKTTRPSEKSKEQFSYSFPPEMVRSSSIDKTTLHKNYSVNYPVENIERIVGFRNFTPIEVLDVEEGEYQETYDIEVKNRNEFYCNGILVHNSAIWAGLNWLHPDINKFMNLKNYSEALKASKLADLTFPLPMELTNISVIYDTPFFIAIENPEHPKHEWAKKVWLKNCHQAFSTAEPGMSFNFRKDAESLRNACTEVTSEDDSDKCNLGTLWLNRMKDKKDLAEATKYATLFLLCGGIYSDVPTDKIKEVGLKNNRIGLGLGGIHEWLMGKGQDYAVTPELHKFLSIYEQESDSAAFMGAKQLGVSVPKGVRAIAPTGTIGIIAESTTGIEPLFCKAYKRRYFRDGKWMYQYVVDGSVKRLLDQGVKLENIKDSGDLTFKQRVKFQADVQNYVDMSISSTCNMDSWGSPSNNEGNYEKNAATLLKYAKRLRGFTVYPDGSRGGQPLTRVSLEEALKDEGKVFEESERECLNGVCGL